MATELREQCSPRLDLRNDFLSCGSRFEYQITDAGFNIVSAQPRVNGTSVAQVNNRPVFHREHIYLPKNIILTGPLYTASNEGLDEDIATHLKKGSGASVLVTM